MAVTDGISYRAEQLHRRAACDSRGTADQQRADEIMGASEINVFKRLNPSTPNARHRACELVGIPAAQPNISWDGQLFAGDRYWQRSYILGVRGRIRRLHQAVIRHGRAG
jgi:hypothetical protein